MSPYDVLACLNEKNVAIRVNGDELTIRAPKDAIEALALANPDGVKAKETSFKRLPLHIACQSHAPADMVAALLSFYPQGAADTDVLGRLPLHYAW